MDRESLRSHAVAAGLVEPRVAELSLNAEANLAVELY